MTKAFGPTSFAERRSAVSSSHPLPDAPPKGSPKPALPFDLVFGVLAKSKDESERTEQSCLVFSKTGLVTVTRKILPTDWDTSGDRLISPYVEDLRSSM